MKNVVLAAGYATRLGELTKNFPKPLLKIGENTILDRMLDDIDRIPEIDEHIIITNHKFAPIFAQWAKDQGQRDSLKSQRTKVKSQPQTLDLRPSTATPPTFDGNASDLRPSTFDRNRRWNKPITIVDDGSTANDNRLGAVRDLLLVLESLPKQGDLEGLDDLLVVAADNLLFFSFQEFVDFAKEKGTSCIMCHEQPSIEKLQRTGVVELDANNRVLRMEEKPQVPKSHWAVPPFYIYMKKDLDLVRHSVENGCGKDAPGNLAHYMVEHTTMHAWPMTAGRFDIGSLDTYYEAVEKYGDPSNSPAQGRERKDPLTPPVYGEDLKSSLGREDLGGSKGLPKQGDIEGLNMQHIDLNGKTILVTGAAGFIGSNLVKRLLKELKDATIVGIDNMNDYYDVALKEYRLKDIESQKSKVQSQRPTSDLRPQTLDNKWIFIKADIADKPTIDALFDEYRFDVVVNLAAQAGVRYSITNPDAYIQSNIIGFYNILEACRHSVKGQGSKDEGQKSKDEGQKSASDLRPQTFDGNASDLRPQTFDGNASDLRPQTSDGNASDLRPQTYQGVQHLIYASSSSVYGGNKKVPFSTDDRVDNPVSLYAATKKSNELMAHCYSKLYNIPSTGLRFFTVYGPAGRPDMAYFGFTNRLIKGETIQIFNYGNCRRDFTYVDDIVEGIWRVMQRPPASPQPSPKGKGDGGIHTADPMLYGELKKRAEEMRKNPTEAESVLWNALRANGLGVKFRQQHIIEDFIVDFYCNEYKVTVEVDGGYHNTSEQTASDAERTARLNELGYTELRFTNEEVLHDLDNVLKKIKTFCSGTPSPSGEGRGEACIPSPSGEGPGEAVTPSPSGEGRGEACIPSPSGEGQGEAVIYNIGGGQPENLLDFVNILQEELVRAGVLPQDFDFEAHKQLVPMQPGDVPTTYADSTALERDFGFTPKITLREGLRKFAEWYAAFYTR